MQWNTVVQEIPHQSSGVTTLLFQETHFTCNSASPPGDIIRVLLYHKFNIINQLLIKMMNIVSLALPSDCGNTLLHKESGEENPSEISLYRTENTIILLPPCQLAPTTYFKQQILLKSSKNRASTHSYPAQRKTISS